MNELKWQRTQLLRIQAQQKAKQGGVAGAAKKPVPKVTQGPVKKVGPTKQVCWVLLLYRVNSSDGMIFEPLQAISYSTFTLFLEADTLISIASQTGHA